MNNAWSIELYRIFGVVLSTIVFGFISDYWLPSVSLHFCLYIAWTIIQLRSFEFWIRNGAHSKSAPNTSGIWALIVQHIYRTQRKNKERKKNLASLAKKYQAIMKALPDATIVLNDEYEIEWANKVSEKILGVDLHRDTGHRVDYIVRDLAVQKLLEMPEEKAEVRFLSPVDQQITLVMTKVSYGEQQTLLIARDISQREALQKMRKAFIANASHELRTPLTVISGYLEMLDGDEDLPAPMNKVISNAYQQAVRMDRILDDLLILSKLEEKGFSKERGAIVDVPELLERLSSDFEKIPSNDSHQLTANINKNLKLKIIEGQFYSLCQNLINNAVKYSEAGSKITLCWDINSRGDACLKVTDTGEGIAPEHLSQLTERFYRINVNRSRKVGGTGLGLSIVKHIVENYGGHLEIKSELGVGSTFTACFPSSRVHKN